MNLPFASCLVASAHSSTFKEPHEDIGPTWIIQDNFFNLIPSELGLGFLLLFNVTYSNV
jgi:hypothetical protein